MHLDIILFFMYRYLNNHQTCTNIAEKLVCAIQAKYMYCVICIVLKLRSHSGLVSLSTKPVFIYLSQYTSFRT